VHFEEVDLLGMPRKSLRAVRGARISFIPQNPFGALNPVLRLERQFENVIRAHRDVPRAECRLMARAVLEQVGIAGPERVLEGYAHELSGGMAQRVVIALALVLNPALVIADEPTTGLDPTVQRQILNLIAELLRGEDRALLLVTHDLGIIAQYCHRVIVMYAGTIVETGSVSDVFRQPAHPYTRALLRSIPRSGQPIAGVGGSLPDLVDYPAGCPFRERCNYAFATCAEKSPSLREIGVTHEVSCHLEQGVMPALDSTEGNVTAAS
jgi:oligopeptide/dipeptide ABC transporter ATP-binding protein